MPSRFVHNSICPSRRFLAFALFFLCLTLPIPAWALINPAIYTEKADYVVSGEVLAVSIKKDSASGTTQVVIVLKVSANLRDPNVAAPVIPITISYLSDSPALRQAAEIFAAKPAMPGPQLLTPPAIPSVHAKGTFYLKPMDKNYGGLIYEPASYQYSFEIKS